ncbi:MAG: hypothetical protein ACFB9M_02800 [Myxococcota bacterium]
MRRVREHRAQHRFRWRSVILAASFGWSLGACSAVGLVCETIGSTDECDGDTICTFIPHGVPQGDPLSELDGLRTCNRICFSQEDCAEGEVCASVGVPEVPATSCQTFPSSI